MIDVLSVAASCFWIYLDNILWNLPGLSREGDLLWAIIRGRDNNDMS
jgi:hypothetical protein